MAIADLIEAVERGCLTAEFLGGNHQDWPDDVPHARLAALWAFEGDINSAVALLEAVLPGWCYTIDVREAGWTRAWTDERSGLRRPGHSGSCNDNPARALLLAILKALAAKGWNDD